MACHGHETWHPAPEFYYQPGGGPMFDMGPYYLTALVNLIGPVRRATGMTAISLPERRITSQPLYGKIVKVEVPTHVTGLLEFANGALGTIIQTFDVWASHLPLIEIHGTRGSLSVPDPNGFGGTVQVKVGGSSEGWQPVPLTHASYTENSRGLGVADMARALATGRKPRAGSDLTFHVLDIMHAVHDAAKLGRQVDLESTCDRPAPLPLGLAEGTLD
jgi:predicted dehydrogenase